MILRNVTVYGKEGKKNIRISGGVIESILDAVKDMPAGKDEVVYDLEGAVAFPGFINSHDHLDFNLYPQLGNRIYKNYTEWGKDIHARNKDVITAVKKVPESLRIQWGLYKNLLNGFTTVVNHGKKLNASNELVNVFQECHSLHSVAFEKYWWLRLNNPFMHKRPYVIHVGEGVDEKTTKEIDKLIKLNYLRKKLIGVHGVSMTELQATAFKALVWCPASNYFLLGKTAAVNLLKGKTNIVFGTDSALTAPSDIMSHFKLALSLGLVTQNELTAMLTSVPARVWGLKSKGELIPGKDADITVLSSGDLSSADILLVIKSGNVFIQNESFLPADSRMRTFTRINLYGKIFMVKEGLKELKENILKYYPEAEIHFTTY